jgi:hypothetical protein
MHELTPFQKEIATAVVRRWVDQVVDQVFDQAFAAAIEQKVQPCELIRHKMPLIGWCVSAAEHEHVVANLKGRIAELEDMLKNKSVS